MPPGTALLELWSQPNMWPLYEHTAQWAGLHYRCVPKKCLHVQHAHLHVCTTVTMFGWDVHVSAIPAIFCGFATLQPVAGNARCMTDMEF